MPDSILRYSDTLAGTRETYCGRFEGDSRHGRRFGKNNLLVYSAPPVVSYYASLNYLTPCERLLFDGYIKPGSDILDLGVGGGRTTAYLAGRSSHYVGLDYAAAMIRVCQTKFPHLEFRVADAADLSAFQDGSFDAVVFAFNGIDFVLPAEARRACLGHIHRVLRPGGMLIFFFPQPTGDSGSAGLESRPTAEDRPPIFWPIRTIVPIVVCRTYELAVSVGPGPVGMVKLAAFFQENSVANVLSGEGNLADTAHGGLLTHYWIPERAIDELTSFHFRIERVVGNEYPQPLREYSTDWYYYVFAKRG